MDEALTPPSDGDYQDYGLFAETRGGAEAVAKKKTMDDIRDRVVAAE